MAMERSDKRLEQAAEWHARLSNETAGEADWLAFTAWLEADDANRLAYDRVEDMLMDLAAEPVLENAAPVEAAPFAEEPAASPSGANVIDARNRFDRRRFMAFGLSAAAAMLLAVAGVHTLLRPNETVETYETGVGEQRMVALSDGTSVHLNTHSKIVVHFTADARRTELAYGEALYSVAKNKERPFYVNVGSDSVRVVGTVFNILRKKDAVKVTVQEGVVEVSPTKPEPATKQPPVRLLPGHQFRRDATHTEGAVGTVDPATVTAWQHGLLDYEEARLIDVAEDLNRYYKIPIRVEGKARDERFSGVLKTTDQDSALAVLAGGLPIRIERTDTEIRLVPTD